MTRPTPTTASTEQEKHRRAAALVLLAGAALALLNSTSATVTVPAIQSDLALTPAGVSWTLAGWALTYALALIPAGWLGDRFGHRRLYMLGIGLFAVTSVATGLVQDEAQLVLARLLQGASGGLFYPAVGASLSLLYSGVERGRMFAALGATIGAAAAIGPIVGALSLQALGPDLGWRALFLLNLPLGLLVILSALRYLPFLRPEGRSSRFDLVGFVLITVGLSATLIPLIVGESAGWPLWCWALLGVGLVMVVVFALWEWREEVAGRGTILSPRMFRQRDFGISAALSFLQFASFISIFSILALLWQTGLGRSPLEMGILTLPEALASIGGAALVAGLTKRFGSRWSVIIGAAVLALGVASVAAVVLVLPAEQLSVWWLMAPLALTGIGSGIALSATLNHALSSVDPVLSGAASGSIASLQRLGNAVGLSLITGVFFAVLQAQRVESESSYATAAAAALIACTAIAIAGAGISLLLPRPRRHSRSDHLSPV